MLYIILFKGNILTEKVLQGETMQDRPTDSSVLSQADHQADNEHLESAFTTEEDPVTRIDIALQRISSAVHKVIDQEQRNLDHVPSTPNTPNIVTQPELLKTIHMMQQELLTNVNALLLNMQHILNALTPHTPSNHTPLPNSPRRKPDNSRKEKE